MNSFFLPYCVIGSFFHISFPEVFPIKNLLVFSSFLMALHGFPTLFEQFFSLNYSFYSTGVQKNNYSCTTKSVHSAFPLGLFALYLAYCHVNRNFCKMKLYENTKNAKQTKERQKLGVLTSIENFCEFLFRR